jgi:dipeptidyl aminopeptidase/acylaminoacyl peptidase
MGTLREEYRGVMGPDGRAVAIPDRDRDTGRWWVNAKDRVGLRQIWSGNGYMIDTPALLGFGRTNESILISVPGSSQDEIYEVPLAGGEPERLYFGDYGQPGPMYHPLDGRLLGFSFLGETQWEYVFLDQQAGRAWASVQQAFPNTLLSMVSATPDFMSLVVRTDGGQDAGTFHLVDLNSGRAVRIGSAYPAVPAASIGEVRWINYRAADGMTIPAYLTLPAGREARDLPLIVMPHGGPQARDMPGFDYWTQLLASRGYAVLQPQFRGSDGFGNAHLEAGHGQWGRAMQTDLSDGVRHLASEGLIDPQRVCIWGWSYGGYAAMAGPTIDPGVYRCAAAGAGVSDLPQMLSWSRDQTGGRDTDTMRYWKRFMGVDAHGRGSLDEVSPARMVQNVDVPILLIHGRDDSVVPYEQTEIFARALQRAGKDVEVIDISGDDHWLSTAAGRLQVFQALIPFLEEHNPPYQ